RCYNNQSFIAVCFNKEMEQAIHKAVGHRNPDEVLSSSFKLRITRRDLSTLTHHSWLNDEVINFYLNLLMARSEREGCRRVYAFSTFFIPKLRAGGYQAVRRWTKGMDLFEKDLILVPVHQGVHWCLAVIDFGAKTVKYYDSMGQRNEGVCRILLLYLKEEFKSKKSKDLEVSKWTVTSAKSNEIPQQMNGSDCGVFVCKYADYITRAKPMTFTQVCKHFAILPAAEPTRPYSVRPVQSVSPTLITLPELLITLQITLLTITVCETS
ncbi:SENP2 protease, partial [Polyodon spathula]|nr:SENP2 protease [Polyodon spathula]